VRGAISPQLSDSKLLHILAKPAATNLPVFWGGAVKKIDFLYPPHSFIGFFNSPPTGNANLSCNAHQNLSDKIPNPSDNPTWHKETRFPLITHFFTDLFQFFHQERQSFLRHAPKTIR